MQASWNGIVIANSNKTVVIEGNHYFPIADVDTTYLKQSETHTICPWKGTASYYHIVVGGDQNKDAAWYYAEPSSAAKAIKNHVAFWKGVEVTE
jgi:uncharacterized protein (DUF427 family)